MRIRQQVSSLLLDYPDASYEKIGSIVHCSKQRVHQIAKSAGLTRKRRPPHYRSDVTVDKVLELYHRNLLIKEIAPILGCCPNTVIKRLREAGIGPGMLRGIYKNPDMYEENYWGKYGNGVYFTSDGARLVRKDNFRLTGRVDDVMKVAGHRLSTAEVENAIGTHEAVAECAVVAAPHEVKGEAPWAFVRLKNGEGSDKLAKELMDQVLKVLGPTCRPDRIIFTKAVPRTRSGKIMRRILKSLVKNEPIGDITTIENPESVEGLKKLVGYKGTD